MYFITLNHDWLGKIFSYKCSYICKDGDLSLSGTLNDPNKDTGPDTVGYERYLTRSNSVKTIFSLWCFMASGTIPLKRLGSGSRLPILLITWTTDGPACCVHLEVQVQSHVRAQHVGLHTIKHNALQRGRSDLGRIEGGGQLSALTQP